MIPSFASLRSLSLSFLSQTAPVPPPQPPPLKSPSQRSGSRTSRTSPSTPPPSTPRSDPNQSRTIVLPPLAPLTHSAIAAHQAAHARSPSSSSDRESVLSPSARSNVSNGIVKRSMKVQRLRPPSLQASVLLAYARGWMLTCEETELRARLSATATDKHSLKLKLHTTLTKFTVSQQMIQTQLNVIAAEEERLRAEFDQYRYQKPSADELKNDKTIAVDHTDIRASVWASLEAVLHKRNQLSKQAAVVEASLQCMTQALYQTHISLQNNYTHFGDNTTTTHTTITTRRKQSDNQSLTASNSSNNQRDLSNNNNNNNNNNRNNSNNNNNIASTSNVKSVSSVDDWVLSAVNRLSALRTREMSTEKRLSKLVQSRELINAYFKRIENYQRRMQEKRRERRRQRRIRSPQHSQHHHHIEEEDEFHNNYHHDDNNHGGGGGDDDDDDIDNDEDHIDDDLENERINQFVFDHRNRKTLHRIVSHMDNSNILNPKTFYSNNNNLNSNNNNNNNNSIQLHKCIETIPLCQWLLSQNIVPTLIDAYECIDLMVRAGLLKATQVTSVTQEQDSDTDSDDDSNDNHQRHISTPASATGIMTTATDLKRSHSSIRALIDTSQSFADPLLQTAALTLTSANASLTELSKSGWLSKHGRYRSYPRFFVWDSDIHRLSCFQSHKDRSATRVYYLNNQCVVRATSDNRLRPRNTTQQPVSNQSGNTVINNYYIEITLMPIQHGEELILLGADTARERDDWVRVFTLGGCHNPNSTDEMKATMAANKQNAASMSIAGTVTPPRFSDSFGSASVPILARRASELILSAFRPAPAAAATPSSNRAMTYRNLNDSLNDSKDELGSVVADSDSDSDDESANMSVPERRRETQLIAEFGQQRYKSKALLQHAITAVQSSNDINDLGLVDVIHDDGMEDENEPGQTTTVTISALTNGDDADLAYDWEEEDDEDEADDSHSQDGDDENDDTNERNDDDGEGLQRAAAANAEALLTAEQSMRRLERRRKGGKLILRLQTLLATDNNAVGRLLTIFNKSFRALYGRALTLEVETSTATTAVQRRQSGSSVLQPVLSLLPAPLLAISGNHNRTVSNVLDSRRQTTVNSPPSPSSSNGSGNNSNVPTMPPSPRQPPSPSSQQNNNANNTSTYPYRRHVKSVLKFAVDDIATFIQHVRQMIFTHIDTSFHHLHSDHTRITAEFIPSEVFIHGADENSVLSPTNSLSSSTAKTALAERDLNKDITAYTNICQRLMTRYLFQTISPYLYPLYITKTYSKDVMLQVRIDQLRNVTWKSLGLSEDLLLPGMDEPAPLHSRMMTNTNTTDDTSQLSPSSSVAYNLAVIELMSMSRYHDPYDKLSCILRVARTICRCVDNVHKSVQPVVINADDLLLLFAYLIVRATPPQPLSSNNNNNNNQSSNGCRWHAQIALMTDFVTDKQRCMLRGYYLATVQAAVELVMSDDLTKRHVVTSHSAESLERTNSDLAILAAANINNQQINDKLIAVEGDQIH